MSKERLGETYDVGSDLSAGNSVHGNHLGGSEEFVRVEVLVWKCFTALLVELFEVVFFLSFNGGRKWTLPLFALQIKDLRSCYFPLLTNSSTKYILKTFVLSILRPARTLSLCLDA